MRRPWLILLLALLNGLVYVFLVPPWQHYDEPNHFEYAWLAAHHPGWPQEGDFDRAMRVATLQSMIAHDFFRGMGGIPDLEAPEPWIGPVPQVGGSPLYYGLVSVPLRFLPPLEIDRQLYAARLVSLLLFVGTVYLGGLTTALLVPRTSPLRWMAPAFLATLPAFADLMTAVNNDVAAVAAFALFLFAATRLMVRGWRWQDVLLLVLAAGLCLLAKRTVFFAAALVPVALLFSILRGERQRWAWGLFAIGAAMALIASVRFGDAAGWYRRTLQQAVTRTARPDAPDGAYALRLQIGDNNPQYQLLQLLPTETLPTLAGQTVTLGAWLWASEPASMPAPRVVLIGKPTPKTVQGEATVSLSTSPVFYAWTLVFPEDPGKRGWVQFGPLTGKPAAPVEVFIDGAVLATGDFSSAEGAPQWLKDSRGLWSGQPVENLLRAPSGERAWLNPRPWADDVWSWLFGYSGQRWASFVLYTLRDCPGAGWYYQITGASLFRTFWAKFGWGHVPLLGHKPYRWLLLASGMLAAGGLWGLWRARRFLRGDVLLLYALSLGAAWGLAIVRGAHHVLSRFVSIPVARYTFPVVLPLALFFALGMLTWGRALGRLFPPLRKIPGLLWGLFLAALTVWSWASLYVFYA